MNPRAFRALLLALVLAVPSAAPVGAAGPRAGRPAGVIRVHDGDTFSIGREKIRLRGIDTPELGRPGARAAARRLAALLARGRVTIVRRGRDVYGRTLADVFVGGHNVADILRREGFASRR